MTFRLADNGWAVVFVLFREGGRHQHDYWLAKYALHLAAADLGWNGPRPEHHEPSVADVGWF